MTRVCYYWYKIDLKDYQAGIQQTKIASKKLNYLTVDNQYRQRRLSEIEPLI